MIVFSPVYSMDRHFPDLIVHNGDQREVLLRRAVDSAKLNEIEGLLDGGVNTNTFDQNGLSLLGQAFKNFDRYYPTVRMADYDVIEILLKHAEGRIESLYNNNCSILDRKCIDRIAQEQFVQDMIFTFSLKRAIASIEGLTVKRRKQ